MKKLLLTTLCAAAPLLTPGGTLPTPAPTDANALTRELTRLPRAELPARTRSILLQTPAAQQTSMGIALAKTVARHRPSLLVPVVAGLATADTNAAPAIAAAAAASAPQLAPDVAWVASQAAPTFAQQIFAAVQTAVPKAHDALARRRGSLASLDQHPSRGHHLGRRSDRHHPPADDQGENEQENEGHQDHDHHGNRGDHDDHGPDRYDEP